MALRAGSMSLHVSQSLSPSKRKQSEDVSNLERHSTNASVTSKIKLTLQDSHSINLLTSGEIHQRARHNWAVAVKKVLGAITFGLHRHPGTAPGIDILRTDTKYLDQQFRGNVDIHVMDYFKEPKFVFPYPHMSNYLSPHALLDFKEFLARSRPDWARVRWINVHGFAWDVIKEISLRFNLHPLCVEELMQPNRRVKNEYYDLEGFIFCSLSVIHGTQHEILQQRQQQMQRKRASEAGDEPLIIISKSRNFIQHLLHSINCFLKSLFRAAPKYQYVKHWAEDAASILLIRDPNSGQGTIVSIFNQCGAKITDPIWRRLLQRTCFAREQDASFLLNLLVDAVVDHMYPVVEGFSRQLAEFESRVRAGNLSASATEQLHIMQTDLQYLSRKMRATLGVVRTLIKREDKGGEQAVELSRTTKTYLRDVEDHVRTISEDLDSLSTQCSELVALIFNLIAHQSNSSMQTLAVVSVIFLPLSFIAGVYGTNWDVLPELHWKRGYMYMWLLMLGITFLFLSMLQKMGMLVKQHT